MSSKKIHKMVAMPAEEENNLENIVSEKNVDETNNGGISFSESNENLISSVSKVKSQRKRETFNDKFTKIMKIILKLAKIDGYDVLGRVRNKKGEFIDSSIISLMNNAMTHGKLLLGQNEFISLLKEANVEPDLIYNENVRAKLINIHTNQTLDYTNTDLSSSQIKKIDTFKINTANKSRILKRKRMRNDEDLENLIEDEIQPSKKRKIQWETLNSSNDDDLINQSRITTNNQWEINPHE
jgi:hypothetical protein